MKYASRNFIDRRIAKHNSVPWHFLLMSYNRAKKKYEQLFPNEYKKGPNNTVQLPG